MGVTNQSLHIRRRSIPCADDSTPISSVPSFDPVEHGEDFVAYGRQPGYSRTERRTGSLHNLA